MARRSQIAFATEGAGARSGSAGGAKTFVLVHGAWHGGWCWRPVVDALRAQGHRVFTPTQTGLGERKHLLSRDITLNVFVDDIANLVEAEELRDVIFVGHSFGGCAIIRKASGNSQPASGAAWSSAPVLRSSRAR